LDFFTCTNVKKKYILSVVNANAKMLVITFHATESIPLHEYTFYVHNFRVISNLTLKKSGAYVVKIISINSIMLI